MLEDRWCEGPGCEASIAYLRPQAKYCSTRCRKAAFEARKQTVVGDRTVSLAGERGYFNAPDATRGYLHDWLPQDATKIVLGRAKQILAEYEDQLPLTVRQVYYRVIASHHYPKGEVFERSLYAMLDSARRSRAIKFEHISDDGIMGGGNWWPTCPEDMLDSWRLQAQSYDRDAQEGQSVRVQVWCEAAGGAHVGSQSAKGRRARA